MIKTIHIENFKSIEKQTISFDQLSMLIGENGSGKTNLIHAISFIKKVVLGPNLAEAYKSFAALPSELLNKRSNTRVIKINICLMNGDDTEYNLYYDFSLDSATPFKNLLISFEKFTTTKNNQTQTVFERKDDNIVIGQDSVDGSPNFKIGGSVSAMSLIDHPAVQKVKSILSEVYISAADISASGSKDPLEEKVIAAIVALRKKNEAEYKKFEVVIKKLIPALSSLTDVSDTISQVVRSGNEYQILFTEKNMEGSLSMKAGSHGDLRTYYILALAFYAEAHSTIIIEELENGIHTKRAKDLIDYLEKIAFHSDKQLIVSSHNPRLIGKVPYEKLILVERSMENGSVYKKLKDAANVPALEKFLEQGGEIHELV